MINIINISPVLSTFVSNVIQKQTFLLGREGVEWPEIQQDTQKGHFRGANFWAKLCPKIRVPNCHFFPCFKQIWAKNVGTKRSFGHIYIYIVCVCVWGGHFKRILNANQSLSCPELDRAPAQLEAGTSLVGRAPVYTLSGKLLTNHPPLLSQTSPQVFSWQNLHGSSLPAGASWRGWSGPLSPLAPFGPRVVWPRFRGWAQHTTDFSMSPHVGP